MSKKSNEFSGLSMPNFQMYLAAQNFKTLKNVNNLFENKKKNERSVSPISNQILINNNFINIQTINNPTPTFTKRVQKKETPAAASNFHNHRNIVKKKTRSVSPNEIQNFTKQNFFINIDGSNKSKDPPSFVSNKPNYLQNKKINEVYLPKKKQAASSSQGKEKRANSSERKYKNIEFLKNYLETSAPNTQREEREKSLENYLEGNNKDYFLSSQRKNSGSYRAKTTIKKSRNTININNNNNSNNNNYNVNNKYFSNNKSKNFNNISAEKSYEKSKNSFIISHGNLFENDNYTERMKIAPKLPSKKRTPSPTFPVKKQSAKPEEKTEKKDLGFNVKQYKKLMQEMNNLELARLNNNMLNLNPILTINEPNFKTSSRKSLIKTKKSEDSNPKSVKKTEESLARFTKKTDESLRELLEIQLEKEKILNNKNLWLFKYFSCWRKLAKNTLFQARCLKIANKSFLGIELFMANFLEVQESCELIEGCEFMSQILEISAENGPSENLEIANVLLNVLTKKTREFVVSKGKLLLGRLLNKLDFFKSTSLEFIAKWEDYNEKVRFSRNFRATKYAQPKKQRVLVIEKIRQKLFKLIFINFLQALLSFQLKNQKVLAEAFFERENLKSFTVVVVCERGNLKAFPSPSDFLNEIDQLFAAFEEPIFKMKELKIVFEFIKEYLPTNYDFETSLQEYKEISEEKIFSELKEKVQNILEKITKDFDDLVNFLAKESLPRNMLDLKKLLSSPQKSFELFKQISTKHLQCQNLLEEFCLETIIKIGCISLDKTQAISEYNARFKNFSDTYSNEFQAFFVKQLDELYVPLKNHFEAFEKKASCIEEHLQQKKAAEYFENNQNLLIKNFEILKEMSKELPVYEKLSEIEVLITKEFPEMVKKFTNSLKSAQRETSFKISEKYEALKEKSNIISNEIKPFISQFNLDAEKSCKALQPIENEITELHNNVEQFFKYNDKLTRNILDPVIHDEKKQMESNIKKICEDLKKSFTEAKKIWESLFLFRKMKKETIETEFVNAQFKQMRNLLEVILIEDFPEILKKEIEQFSFEMEKIELLKEKSLQPKHWQQIFEKLNQKSLLSQGFKVKDLMSAISQEKNVEYLQGIIYEAKKEQMAHRGLEKVKEFYEEVKLKVRPMESRVDLFIVEGIDELIMKIEDDKKNQQFSNEITTFQNYLDQIKEKLELWQECQQKFLGLEWLINTFSESDLFYNEINSYLEIFSHYKKIMWMVNNNPKLSANLNKNRFVNFKKLISALEKVSQHTGLFLESQRDFFPRYYFLSDEQLIDFLSLVNKNKDYRKLLSYLFPGISELNFSYFGDNNIKIKDFKENITKNEDVAAKIIGIVSSSEEELLFNKPLTIKKGGIAEMLPIIEDKMKSAVGALINKAVSAFPNYSLDEWILEYPCQVVITSLHMIVSHEILEMIKILQNHSNKNKNPNDSNSSSSEMTNSNINKEKPEDNNSHISERDIHEILKKPLELTQENREKLLTSEAIEMFGSNVISKYLGADKDENIVLLQKKSFRGLYLRLQFWINQLVQLIPNVEKNELNSKKIESILLFVLFLKDVVLDLYENSSVVVTDFAWNKHVRIVFDQENSACLVECGGWSGYQGNEFLGSLSRMLITPLSEKYFVFISSALREKSGVVFKTDEKKYLSEITEEFASICTVFQISFYIGKNFGLASLFRILRGGVYGSAWVNLEHLNNLELDVFRILSNEILLTQQKYILSEINNDDRIMTTIYLKNNEEEENKNEAKNPEESKQKFAFEKPKKVISSEEIKRKLDKINEKLPNKNFPEEEINIKIEENLQKLTTNEKLSLPVRRPAYGLYASFNNNCELSQRNKEEALALLQSGFRISSFQMPQLRILIEVQLFFEGFVNYEVLARQTSMILEGLQEKINFCSAWIKEILKKSAGKKAKLLEIEAEHEIFELERRVVFEVFAEFLVGKHISKEESDKILAEFNINKEKSVEKALENCLEHSPLVFICGEVLSGKTFLIEKLLANKKYKRICADWLFSEGNKSLKQLLLDSFEEEIVLFEKERVCGGFESFLQEFLYKNEGCSKNLFLQENCLKEVLVVRRETKVLVECLAISNVAPSLVHGSAVVFVDSKELSYEKIVMEIIGKELRKSVLDWDEFLMEFVLEPVSQIEDKIGWKIGKNLCLTTAGLFKSYFNENLQIKPLFFLCFLQSAFFFDRRAARIVLSALFERAIAQLDLSAFFLSPPELSTFDSLFFDAKSSKFLFKSIPEPPKLLPPSSLFKVYIPTRETAMLSSLISLLKNSAHIHSITALGEAFSGKSSAIFAVLQNTDYISCSGKLPQSFGLKTISEIKKGPTFIQIEDISFSDPSYLDFTSLISYLQQHKNFYSSQATLPNLKNLREKTSNSSKLLQKDKLLIHSLILQIDSFAEPSLSTIFKGLTSAFQCPERVDSLLNLFNELSHFYKDKNTAFFIIKKVLFVFANRDFQSRDQNYYAAFEFFHWVCEKNQNVENQEQALQLFRRAMGVKLQRRELLHPENMYVANPVKPAESSYQEISVLKNSFFRNKTQLVTMGNLVKLAKMVSEVNFGWNFIVENSNMPLLREFAENILAGISEFPYENCLEKLDKIFAFQNKNKERKLLVFKKEHFDKKECKEALISYFLNKSFLLLEENNKLHLVICLEKAEQLNLIENFEKIKKNFLLISFDNSLTLKHYLLENKSIKHDSLTQALGFLNSEIMKNFLLENVFYGWKKPEKESFLSNDRLKLFLSFYEQIFEKINKLYEKKTKKIESFLEFIEEFFQKFEANSEKNCSVGVRDTKIKMRLDEIDTHLRNIEKDMHEKTQIITTKKQEKEQLKNNLENLQKELNNVFKEKNNELQGYLEKINGFTNEQFVNFLVKKKGLGVLEAIAILITKEINVDSEKMLKYFSSKNEIIKNLQNIDVLPVDPLIFSEFCGKLESGSEGIESNILLCLLKWADIFKEKVLLYQRLKKSFEMKEKIKNNLLIASQKIEYNQNLIQELHSNQKIFNTEKSNLLEERKKLAPLLKEAEKSIQKKNQLISKIITIQNKAKKKLERIVSYKNKINIDTFLVSIRIVYFSFLNTNLKNKAISNLIKEIKFENSSFQNEEDFEKFFKFALKLNGTQIYNYKFLNVVAKGVIYETLFVFEIAKPSNIAVWDSMGSFKFNFLKIYENCNLKLFEDPLKINEIVEQTQKACEFQFPICNIFLSKLSFCNNEELRKRHIIINFSELNLNDSWMDVKEVLIRSLLPEKEKLETCRNNYFSIKQKKRAKKKSLKQILIEKKSLEFEVLIKNFTEIQNYSINLIKELSEMDNILNEHPLLASYSNIITLMCEAVAKTNQIWEEPGYTWLKIYKILEDTIKKIIRDVSNKKKSREEPEDDEDDSKIGKEDDTDQLTIDEEFFHSYVVVAIWSIFTSQLPPEAVPFASLYLALKVSHKKQSVSDNQVEAFWQKFTEYSNYHLWKNEKSFLKTPFLTPFGNYNSLTQEAINQFKIFLTSYDIFSPSLQAFFSKLKPFSFDKYEELLQKNKTLSLIEKTLCSFLGKRINLKARLTQIIYEELSSIFEFSEDLVKFHHFIKIASWHCPVSVFPEKNVNSINTICSIASYYGVELEVIEIYSEKSFLEKLENAALNGNWILISSENFKKICEMSIPALEKLESEGKVLNSFRLLFDFHAKEIDCIPIDFLCNSCVVFKMGFNNMEDMEGFNDVWANILNDNLLTASLLQENPSKMFPNHSVINKNFTSVNSVNSSHEEENLKKINIGKNDISMGVLNDFDPLAHKLSAISVIINNSFEANEPSLLEEYNALTKNI